MVVVGVALVDRTGPTPRLLAAQRAAPPALCGQWELPGGKVEPGETERAALVRECREELGVDVVVTERVGPDLAVRPGLVLRVYAGELRSGVPQPHEHLALRWLAAHQLKDVAWLPADRPLLSHLVRLLAGPARSARVGDTPGGQTDRSIGSR